jgi:tRNA dimethylallyltransferase
MESEIHNPQSAIEESWFLTGPTAGGKSQVGLELAQLLDAEIISLDSMALYRGMDIGTAKPTAEERRRVPHHLIDIIDPADEFSLAQYIERAQSVAAEIIVRGRRPLFVGGTPLYLKSLLRGIFEGPPADWEFRQRLQTEADKRGGTWLHDRLTQVDPLAASRLHPNDSRRLIRALEVHAKTGQPISELQQQFDRARPAEQCHVVMLDWPREVLYARIDARVDAMFAAGFVEEVRTLLALPRPLSRTARQGVGYRETISYLRGEQDLAETITLIKNHTRQFAKRQLTWFRSLSECRRLELSEPFEAGAVAKAIIGGRPPNI